MKLILMIFLFFSGCTSSKKLLKQKVLGVDVESSEESYLKIVKDDISFLKKSGLEEIFPFFKYVKKINVTKGNCSYGKIACVVPERKSTVFLNYDYFRLDKVDRVTTLLHESAHHRYGYFHVNCLSEKITNKDCDESLDSPFGIEYNAIEYLYRRKSIAKDIYEKKKKNISHRINSLVKKSK